MPLAASQLFPASEETLVLGALELAICNQSFVYGKELNLSEEAVSCQPKEKKRVAADRT